MEENQNNRKCWLVVWNRKKLQVEKFFDAVKDKEVDISVTMMDDAGKQFGEGDSGVIVVREAPGHRRSVYATFTVTGAPRMMKDTHAEFWNDIVDKEEEKLRAIVRFHPSFDPITDEDNKVVSRLKVENIWPKPCWVSEIPPDVYRTVRGLAANI